ncbi:MAG TPA: uracil-DNA glycosylase [Novimethylophilus sp.]|jgi:uracil-DNA glycosylase family 4|uniref:uracil-DNA glycosylase n=1 Tax=Novimethylophilus sp. TaxID=2137426 RepID=UPI002F41345A
MTIFDLNCRLCPRLATFLDEVKAANPAYFCRPVPPFGDDAPRLLIVGLAPGLHGANRTGRPFTGDHAGILLYHTLHKLGFSSAPTSASADDGLRLIDCRITNAVKCLPPANKPETSEIVNCNSYLAAELAQLPQAIVLALGNVAHAAVLRAFRLKPKDYVFGHGARHVLPHGQVLYDSYHCSRYNTQTRRLTEAMFHEVFRHIRNELEN